MTDIRFNEELETAEAYLNSGNLLRQEGKLKQAIEQYQKAIELEPDYSNLYSTLEELQQEKVCLDIWEALNQTNLDNFDQTQLTYPTNIKPEMAENCFRYKKCKVINLNNLTEEEKLLLEHHNLSANNLRLTQKYTNLRLVKTHNSRHKESYVNVLRGKFDPIPQDLSLIPSKYTFIDFSILQTGYAYAVCPITKKIVSTNQSFWWFNNFFPLLIYRFFSCQVFYLLIRQDRFSGDTGIAIYFPKLDLIVSMPGYQQKLLERYISNNRLNSWKGFMVANWQKVLAYLKADHKEVTVFTEFHSNQGHNLVNDLSGLDVLLKTRMLDEVDRILVGNQEFYGELEKIYPEIPKQKIVRFSSKTLKNPKKTAEFILDNNYFALPVRSNFLPEDLARRIYQASLKKCSPSFLAQVEEAKKHFPLILIHIRHHKRVWISQVEGLANIINKLAQDFPNLGIVFDGLSFDEFQIERHEISSKDKSILEGMQVTTQQIIALLSEVNVGIYDAVGCMMHESVVWSHVVDFHISSMGSAGLTKICLLANKPGIVHSNTVHIPKIGWFGNIHRENSIDQVIIPGDNIEGIDVKPYNYCYECDWQVIYDEAVKIVTQLIDSKEEAN